MRYLLTVWLIFNQAQVPWVLTFLFWKTYPLIEHTIWEYIIVNTFSHFSVSISYLYIPLLGSLCNIPVALADVLISAILLQDLHKHHIPSRLLCRLQSPILSLLLLLSWRSSIILCQRVRSLQVEYKLALIRHNLYLLSMDNDNPLLIRKVYHRSESFFRKALALIAGWI